jgi:hypothetical protein
MPTTGSQDRATTAGTTEVSGDIVQPTVSTECTISTSDPVTTKPLDRWVVVGKPETKVVIPVDLELDRTRKENVVGNRSLPSPSTRPR